MPPAAKHFDPLLGIDVHIIQPPGPVPPVPIPHPYTGMVLDPCDYAPWIGGTVTVGGLQRAQAGTGGISIPKHIPIGGVFVKPPADESEIFMGSSTVSVDGDAFTYLGLPVLSCQCIGMPPIPRAKGSSPKSLVLPTTVCLSVPMPVQVGGSPTVSLMALGMRAGMAALGALAKKAKKAWKGRKVKGKGPKKGVNGHKCDGAHPVDVITGANFDAFLDAKAPPPRMFRWQRHYTTARRKQHGPLGYGFRHSYQHTLTLHPQAWVYETPTGRQAVFEPMARGQSVARAHGYVLKKLGPRRYEVAHRDDPALHFERPAKAAGLQLVSVRSGRRFITLEYDRTRLRRLTEHGPEGRVGYVVHHDDRGRIVELQRRSPKGQRRLAHYDYDRNGDLVASVDAEGGRHRYEYDDGHRWLSLRDPRGYAFSWTYDDQGRCTEASGQDGLWWAKFEYDPATQQTRVTERSGGVHTFRYDANGTLRELEDPYGGTLERAVDADGDVVMEIDSGGRALHWLYDAHGAHSGRVDRFMRWLPTEEEMPQLPDPDPIVVPQTAQARQWGEVVPDAPLPGPALLDAPAAAQPLVQWATSWATPADQVPARDYDELGRLCREVDAHGRERTWRYDAAGNAIAYRDRDGFEHQHPTTSWNLRGADIDPLGNRTSYEYTSTEQLAKVVDAGGSASVYAYDDKDRLTSVSRHGRVRDAYTYDAGDHLVEKRDGNGSLLLEIEYDADSLMSRRRLASGEVHRFGYDVSGQLRRADADARRVELCSDADGRRLHDRVDDLGVEHAYVLDDLFQTRCLGFATTYRCASAAGVTTISDPTGEEHRIRAAHGLVRREHANGTIEISRFDGDGACVAMVSWRAGDCGVRSSRAVCFAYSDEGDLFEVVDTQHGRTRYEIDPAHRLAAQVRTQTGAQALAQRVEYRLDPAGNLLEKPGLSRVSLEEGNRLRAANGEAFTYDTRNNIHLRTGPGARSTRYVYDSLDRLVRVEDSRHDEPWTAQYDAIGRRLSAGRGAAQTAYYWDGDRLAAEVDPDGRPRVYVYADAKSFVPILFVDYDGLDAAPEDGRVYTVFTDQIGVPTRVEDERGATVWSATRTDAYGCLDVDAASSIALNLRFPGHYYDEATGLHYNRHRCYDPVLGRYLQSDPIGQSGGINLYAYAPNPLVAVDLLGLAHGTRADANARNADGRSPNAERPKVKEGDVGSYAELRNKQESWDNLEHDHIPNYAALKAKAEAQLGRKLDPDEARRLKNRTTCLEVKKGHHKAGRTHGHKAKKTTPSDAKGNLKDAANKDLATHKDNMVADGYDPADVDNWADDVHKRNDEIGAYDDPLPDSLWSE